LRRLALGTAAANAEPVPRSPKGFVVVVKKRNAAHAIQHLPVCPVQATECSLDCLARGQKGRICEVNGPNRCRLLELGFTAGTEVEVSRRAAWGGPLEIRLRSYRLSLRRDEANAIRVETGGPDTSVASDNTGGAAS